MNEREHEEAANPLYRNVVESKHDCDFIDRHIAMLIQLHIGFRHFNALIAATNATS